MAEEVDWLGQTLTGHRCDRWFLGSFGVYCVNSEPESEIF